MSIAFVQHFSADTITVAAAPRRHCVVPSDTSRPAGIETQSSAPAARSGNQISAHLGAAAADLARRHAGGRGRPLGSFASARANKI
jgi:hypothetical protein